VPKTTSQKAAEAVQERRPTGRRPVLIARMKVGSRDGNFMNVGAAWERKARPADGVVPEGYVLKIAVWPTNIAHSDGLIVLSPPKNGESEQFTVPDDGAQ